MPDSLGLNRNRRVILVFGLPGCGKSDSVVRLVNRAKELGKNIAILDADRGLAENFEEQGFTEDPEHLDYFLIDSWEKLIEARDYVLAAYDEGDWVVIENAYKIWRMARAAYILQTYGMTESEFGEHKQQEAVAQIEEFFNQPQNMGVDRQSEEGVRQARRIRSKVMQFEGLDGRTEWPKITNKYFEALDPLFMSGTFNILTTTWAQRLDGSDLEEDPQWMGVNFRPQGQKGLVGMHSTLARLYRNDGVYYFDTDLNDATKDRGKPSFKAIPISDVGFVDAYEDELEEAKPKKKPAPKKKAAAS